MTANVDLITPALRRELHDMRSTILAKPFLVSSLLESVAAAVERLPHERVWDGLTETGGSSLPK